MRMPFGKWKGRLLEDIPMDYLLWAKEKFTGTWKEAVKKELARRERKKARQENIFAWMEGKP